MSEAAELPARRARIGLGSNEDAARNLARARSALEAEFRVVACTAERETPASEGGSDRYHNQIVDVETALPRAELVARLKRLEAVLGRVRSPGARVVIDLDLLVLAGEFEALEYCTAPHWRLLAGEPDRDA